MNIEVAFLWHFHQPIYSNPENKVLPLPWVRLHAIKDYLDMLKHVQKYPLIRATFNFTPSLLKQILDYKNHECTDHQFLLFRKKADELTADEKIEILRDFFLANWARMIEPNPRYFSLLLKRGKNIVADELPSIAQLFTTEEIRDLQVWANLVWIDPVFRGEIVDLYSKGKNYSETDKDRVIAVQNSILASIIDEYKKAFETEQVDLITSPLYHPILPLLINSELAKVSNPNLGIPFHFSHPEDAKIQIEKGMEIFTRCFGRKPAGIWPSEGAVCQELMPIVSQLGIKWVATDEEILARSIMTSFRRDENGVPNNAANLYKPWMLENVAIIFRDHILSDMISFNYNTWEPKKAANDLVSRIKTIANSLSPFEKFIIPIILDGENAWEYFENDGSEFIDCLYEELIKENVPTTTITQYLNKNESRHQLSRLFPGSWIGGNFNIWIGKMQDHKAWQVVKDLRDKLVAKKIQDPEIWDRFYILEGSDWYWWFGDDFFSVTGEVFDELFRISAAWIYKKIGEEPPHELFSSINQEAVLLSPAPIDRIRPVIDGKVTHFYEWFNAGYADVKRMGGTMQRFSGLFSMIYYGFDDSNVYVRVDIVNHGVNDYEFIIDFDKPIDSSLTLGAGFPGQYKIDEIIEIAVPYETLGIKQGARAIVEFVIRARQKNIEVDRTPLLKFSVSQNELTLYNWSV